MQRNEAMRLVHTRDSKNDNPRKYLIGHVFFLASDGLTVDGWFKSGRHKRTRAEFLTQNCELGL